MTRVQIPKPEDYQYYNNLLEVSPHAKELDFLGQWKTSESEYNYCYQSMIDYLQAWSLFLRKTKSSVLKFKNLENDLYRLLESAIRKSNLLCNDLQKKFNFDLNPYYLNFNYILISPQSFCRKVHQLKKFSEFIELSTQNTNNAIFKYQIGQNLIRLRETLLFAYIKSDQDSLPNLDLIKEYLRNFLSEIEKMICDVDQIDINLKTVKAIRQQKIKLKRTIDDLKNLVESIRIKIGINFSPEFTNKTFSKLKLTLKISIPSEPLLQIGKLYLDNGVKYLVLSDVETKSKVIEESKRVHLKVRKEPPQNPSYLYP